MNQNLSSYLFQCLSSAKNFKQVTTKQSRITAKTISFKSSFLLLAVFIFSTSVIKAQDVLLGLTSNGGPEGKGTAFSIKTDTKAFSIIKGFADWGANPVSDLVRGKDGFLYGMAPTGGTF